MLGFVEFCWLVGGCVVVCVLGFGYLVFGFVCVWCVGVGVVVMYFGFFVCVVMVSLGYGCCCGGCGVLLF